MVKKIFIVGVIILSLCGCNKTEEIKLDDSYRSIMVIEEPDITYEVKSNEVKSYICNNEKILGEVDKKQIDGLDSNIITIPSPEKEFKTDLKVEKAFRLYENKGIQQYANMLKYLEDTGFKTERKITTSKFVDTMVSDEDTGIYRLYFCNNSIIFSGVDDTAIIDIHKILNSKMMIEGDNSNG